MEEKHAELLLDSYENTDAIRLLCKLAESSIENDSLEKIWDAHLLFGVIKKLSNNSLGKIAEIQDDF